MDCPIHHLPWNQITADWLVLPIAEPVDWSPALKQLDQALGGILARLEASGELPKKSGGVLQLRGLTGIASSRMQIVGLGPVGQQTAGSLDRAYTTAARSISDKPDQKIAILLPNAPAGGPDAAQHIRSAIIGCAVGSQGQDLYRTERSRFPFADCHLIASAPVTDTGLQAVEAGRIFADSINLTREVVNRAPADMTPAIFASKAEALAKQYGLTCEVWDQTRLVQERMRAMLAVSAGSAQPPRLVSLSYRGGGADRPTLALVGKGVTFDSGGLSLKPSDSMTTMKCDMAGAGTVLGALVAIARLKLPVNVVGLMGLVENMPDGKAFKLGDILTARNGVTIEVLNTDAEGRLVLADVLSYAVDLKVDRIVDLATLTGACVVALGEDVAGLMTNQDGWCQQVSAAAKTVGEDVWQLPMFDLYDDLIKGDIGDIKNTGGRWGGAISAAKFLQRFVGTTPWVHMDIAGPAFASSSKPWREAGATGMYVKTLVELAKSFT